MNNQYKKIENDAAESQFIESEFLPTDIPITAAINFVHIGSEVVLTQDKHESWGPVHGKLKKDEDWKQALIRETQEEVGVLVHRLTLCGYILSESNGDGSIPSKTISPVCYSYCKDIDSKWVPKEMRGREIFSHSNVKKCLAEREDGDQVLGIYLFIYDKIKQDLQIVFSFLPDKIPEDIIVTSAMVFCVDNEKKVCVVKDGDEDFYSLPGGGRKLLEPSLDCAKRELQEEAQIIGKDFRIFGTILVTFYLKNVLVSKMQQARYICDTDFMEEFIPYKDGFETNERKFVQVDQLVSLVKQFKNKDGVKIIEHLKTRLYD